MSFKFKDLIVDVVPQNLEKVRWWTCYLGTACPNQTFICRVPTFKCFLNTCRSPTFIACHPGTLPPLTGCGITEEPTWTIIEVDPQEMVKDLATLRRDLQAALAQVDAQEKVLAGASGLQTRAQAEAVEAQLQGALKEVQAQKDKLK
jgi:hypothetical protein